MNPIAKSCKMKLIWILVLIVLVRCGRSAPSSFMDSVYTDGPNVGHRAKRSPNLINFVGNMLQKHSGGMDRDWPGFPNMFSYGYGSRNWNSCEMVDDSDQSDDPFYVDLDSSPERPFTRPEERNFLPYNPDTNCPAYVDENRYPEPKNIGFPKVNYQYGTGPRNAHWNIDSGGGFGDSEDCEYGPNSDSVDIDWNKTIPPQGNVELEEVVSKNIYMTPPRLDSRVEKPFFYNQLVPWSRSWQTTRTGFLPGNQEVTQHNPNNVPQFHVLNCSPANGFVKPAIDAGRFGEGSRKVDDGYIVLLIKKNHVLGDRVQPQYPGNTKSTDEGLCSNDSEEVTQKPDLGVPCDTTSEATTTSTTESAPTTTESDCGCTASSETVGGPAADTTYASSAPKTSPVTDCPTESTSDTTDDVIVGSALDPPTEEPVESVTEKADDVQNVTDSNCEGDSSTYPTDSTSSFMTDTPSTTNCYNTSDDGTTKDVTESTPRSTTITPGEGEGTTYTTRSIGGQTSTETNAYEPLGNESGDEILSSDEKELKNVDEDTLDEQEVNLTQSQDAQGEGSTYSVNQGTQTNVAGKQTVYETRSSDEGNIKDDTENTEDEQGVISSGNIVGDSTNQGPLKYVTSTQSEYEESSSDTKTSKDVTEDKEEEQEVGDLTSSPGSTASGSAGQGLYIVMPSDTTSSVEMNHNDANSDEGNPMDFTEDAEDGYMSVFTKKYRGGGQSPGGSLHSTSGTVSGSESQAVQISTSTLRKGQGSTIGTQSGFETIKSDKRIQTEGQNEYIEGEQDKGDFVSLGRQLYGTGIQSEHEEISSDTETLKAVIEDTEVEQTVVERDSSASTARQGVYRVMSSDSRATKDKEHKNTNSDEGFPLDPTENVEDRYQSDFTEKNRGGVSTHSTGGSESSSVSQSAHSSMSASSKGQGYTTGTQSEHDTASLDETIQGKGNAEYSENEQGKDFVYSSSGSVGDLVGHGRQSYIKRLQSKHEETISKTETVKDVTQDKEEEQEVVLSKKNDAAEGDSSSSTGSAVSGSVSRRLYSSTSSNSGAAAEVDHKDTNSDDGFPLDFTEDAEDRYQSEFTKKYRGGRTSSSHGTTNRRTMSSEVPKPRL